MPPAMTPPAGLNQAASRDDAIGRPQRIARILLVVALTLFGLYTLQGFLRPLVWAVIMAVAVWPLFERARRRWPPGKHNLLLPLLFTLAVALIFVVPLVLAAIQATAEFHNLTDWYKRTEEKGLPLPQFIANLPFARQQVTDWWNANLANPHALSDLMHRVDRGSALNFGRTFGTRLTHSVVEFVFTLVALFFILRDAGPLTQQMLTAGQRLVGPSGERLGRQILASVRGTVDGLVLVGLAEGVALGAAFWFAGVPHPTIFGAVAGVAAIIPFGAPLVFVVAALVLVAQGSVTAAIAIVIFGFVVGFIADHVVRPVIIGGATRLPFLWVLLGILGGLETWGLLGLFLGPAVMAALILLWRELTDSDHEDANASSPGEVMRAAQ